MSIEIKIIAWMASVGVVFAVLYGAYEYGRHVEGLRRDNEALTERLAYATAFEKAQTANDKLKTDGAKQHAQDTATINRIRDDFSAFRLRLPKAAPCNGVPDPASGGVDGGAGGGIRPDPEQAAFDRFTDGLKQDAYALDSVLDSCRTVFNYLKAQAKITEHAAKDYQIQVGRKARP